MLTVTSPISNRRGSHTSPRNPLLASCRHGLTFRHIEQGCNVPMYRTNVPCAPTGSFAGPLVVSMRPFNPAGAIRSRLGERAGIAFPIHPHMLRHGCG
jgi:uncharacterized protein YcsI (UPF0317 family)